MSSSVDAKVVREIKIKTGVVKRLLKEKISYEEEAAQIQKKVEQMRATNEDDYLIKKQEELLSESKSMIPDCEGRFIVAWKDLNKLLELEKECEHAEEYKSAMATLEESKSAVR